MMAGQVDEFTTSQVAGWIATEVVAPPVRVGLYLGGLEVAATWATGDGDVRPFSFRIKDVWKFANRWNKLTVRVGGRHRDRRSARASTRDRTRRAP